MGWCSIGLRGPTPTCYTEPARYRRTGCSCHPCHRSAGKLGDLDSRSEHEPAWLPKSFRSPGSSEPVCAFGTCFGIGRVQTAELNCLLRAGKEKPRQFPAGVSQMVVRRSGSEVTLNAEVQRHTVLVLVIVAGDRLSLQRRPNQ